MKLRWTKRALAALTNIHDYIAVDNPVAADQLREQVLVFVETKLLIHPSIGRPGRVDGTRESVIHASYILVYRLSDKVIEIITVRHAAQKWPNQF